MLNPIKQFRITWEIDVEAASAEQAVSQVARDYFQAGHTATSFEAKRYSPPWAPNQLVEAGKLPVFRSDNALELLDQDLEEYELTSDYERADVLAHVAHNLAALLPAAVVKAAIDCAIADALTCLPPSTGQGKADMIRNMMEGPQ